MKLRAALFCILAASAYAGPIAREPGAIYLSDFDLPAVRLSLLEPAPCYFDIDARRYAGTLNFPQTVKLDAVASDGRLRVRGNARQGGVAAWVDPHHLQPLPGDFIPKLRQAAERRRQVEELIARGEAAVGMTTAEVSRSLGKPQKKTSRATRDGSTEVFEYIKYDIIPQTSYTPAYAATVARFNPRGPNRPPEAVVVRTRQGFDASTVWLKVPVGTITVTFVNGIADSIEQSEGTLAGAGSALVVPPVNLVW